MWQKWHKNRLWQNGRDRPNDRAQIKSFGCAMCVPVRACEWYDFGDFISVFFPLDFGTNKKAESAEAQRNSSHIKWDEWQTYVSNCSPLAVFSVMRRCTFDPLSLCHSSDANVIVVCASDQCTVWWNSRISNSLRIAYLLKNKCNLSSQSFPSRSVCGAWRTEPSLWTYT